MNRWKRGERTIIVPWIVTPFSKKKIIRKSRHYHSISHLFTKYFSLSNSHITPIKKSPQSIRVHLRLQVVTKRMSLLLPFSLRSSRHTFISFCAPAQAIITFILYYMALSYIYTCCVYINIYMIKKKKKCSHLPFNVLPHRTRDCSGVRFSIRVHGAQHRKKVS